MKFAMVILASLIAGSGFAGAGHLDPVWQVLESPSCIDSGQGGAACSFDCNVGNILAVSVTSFDEPPGTASVRGAASCGGVQAFCEGDISCAGTSEPTKAGGSGSCYGESDEPFWAMDNLELTCAAAPAPGEGGEQASPSSQTTLLRMIFHEGALHARYEVYRGESLVMTSTWAKIVLR